MIEKWTTKMGWRPELGEYVLVTEDYNTFSAGDIVRVLGRSSPSAGPLYIGKAMTTLIVHNVARIVPGGTKVPDGAECVHVIPGSEVHMCSVPYPEQIVDCKAERMFAVLSVSTPDPKQAERERLEAKLVERKLIHEDCVSVFNAEFDHVRNAWDDVKMAEAALKELGT
jgi:hypothetical protein